MEFKEKENLFVLAIFSRLTVFFLTYGFILLFFFLVGNFQNFLDTTQILILQLLSYTSIILIIFTFSLVVLHCLFSILKKNIRFLLFLPLDFFMSAIGLVFLFASRGIIFINSF
ncbi:MAG: hypothetical protein ACRC5H_00895 [Treponemataceae bacterium]